MLFWFFLCKFLATSAPVLVLTLLIIRGCAGDSLDLATMETTELIRYWGYNAETHEVTTEDGYILQVHRIVKEGGPPVVFQHGGLGSSDILVLRGPEKDLSFMLADKGHDIWLPNFRGNIYSRKHVNMTTKDAEFWEFSFHEIGYYDLPAVIDYVLNTTGYSNLIYIGHSLGATIFHVLTSTRPEYNDKIALSVNLSPVVFISHVSGIARTFARLAGPYSKILRRQGQLEIFSRHGWSFLGVCLQKNVLPLCMEIAFLALGRDRQQLDPITFRRFVGHFPSGSSTKTLEHAFQSFQSGEFRMFCFGETKNLEVYNSKFAPEYNLSLITVPVSLHYSENDLVARPEDVDILASKLPNLVGKFKVPFKGFSHIDFLWARDVRRLLNDNIMSIIKDYRPKKV